MSEYIPNRMCALCRNRFPKSDLVRLAKIDGKIAIDDHNGHGVYVCASESCANKIKTKKILNKIVKCDIPDEVYEQLIEKRG